MDETAAADGAHKKEDDLTKRVLTGGGEKGGNERRGGSVRMEGMEEKEEDWVIWLVGGDGDE